MSHRIICLPAQSTTSLFNWRNIIFLSAWALLTRLDSLLPKMFLSYLGGPHLSQAVLNPQRRSQSQKAKPFCYRIHPFLKTLFLTSQDQGDTVTPCPWPLPPELCGCTWTCLSYSGLPWQCDCIPQWYNSSLHLETRTVIVGDYIWSKDKTNFIIQAKD